MLIYIGMLKIRHYEMAQLLCDLFYYSSESVYTDSMFEEMWNHDKNQFLAIAFYLRRHRRYNKSQQIPSRRIIGRGEREIFYQIVIWMSRNKLHELTRIIPYIPDCGYWKDLLVLMGTPAENVVIELFSTQLLRDYHSFNQDIPGLISLAAKWTPNESSSSDRKHKTFSKISKAINVSKKILRTKFLVPLRKYLGVTEQIIGDHKWQSINYDVIPQLSLKLHTKTFEIKDGIRFNGYLNRTHVDHIKKLLLPGSVNCIINNEKFALDGITRNDSVIFAIDVSGSMAGFPITTAACLYGENGADHWIPLSFDNLLPSVETDEIVIGTTGTTFSEKIQPILRYKGRVYDLESTIRASELLRKTHMIILSNVLLDKSEYPVSRSSNIHLTYWAINNRPPVIYDYPQLSIIEGYDINIYLELQKGTVLLRTRYKDLVIQTIQEESMVPLI